MKKRKLQWWCLPLKLSLQCPRRDSIASAFIILHLPPLLAACPRKDLDDAVTAPTDDPSAVLAPDDAADTFAAHEAMACYFLRARSFFERPEA